MCSLNLDRNKLMRYNPSDVEFIENGKVGWRTNEGEILIPAEYDQIEKCAESLYLRNGDCYEIYYEYGAISFHHDYNEGSFFVKNKKFGWRTDKTVIIPPTYDYIHAWSNDVFCVKRDNRYFYINSHEEEVLTNVRRFKDEEEDGFPFQFSKHDKSIITLCEFVGHPSKKDSNVVRLGPWVKLDRISHEEIMQALINPEDESPITATDLEGYNSQFSYEFNIYKAKSKKGIQDCLKKINQMGAFGQTWYYIIRVCKAPNEVPTAEELRYLRYYIESKNNIGKITFGLGHDPLLKQGETHLLMLTYYNEECFPPDFEFEWNRYAQEHTLQEIKEKIKTLRKTIEEDILPEYIGELWQNQFDGIISNIGYFSDRSWEETVKVLDFLKNYDHLYKTDIYSLVKEFFGYKTNSTDKDDFLLHKLQWLIDNSADVNYHRCNTTPIDVIACYRKERHYLYNECAVKRCLDILLRHGALSMKQLIEEECQNTDYRIELQRMR